MKTKLGLLLLLSLTVTGGLQAKKHTAEEYDHTGKVLKVFYDGPTDGSSVTAPDGTTVTCASDYDLKHTYCHDGVPVGEVAEIQVELDGQVGVFSYVAFQTGKAFEGGALAQALPGSTFKYRIRKNWPATFYEVLVTRVNSNGTTDSKEDTYTLKVSKDKKSKGDWSAQ